MNPGTSGMLSRSNLLDRARVRRRFKGSRRRRRGSRRKRLLFRRTRWTTKFRHSGYSSPWPQTWVRSLSGTSMGYRSNARAQVVVLLGSCCRLSLGSLICCRHFFVFACCCLTSKATNRAAFPVLSCAGDVPRTAHTATLSQPGSPAAGASPTNEPQSTGEKE